MTTHRPPLRDLPGTPIRVRATRNPWAAYEAAKRDLDRERPELTPQQRDAALRAIAKRLGV